MKTAFIGSLIMILPASLFLLYWQSQTVEEIITPDIPQQVVPLVTSSSTSKLDPHMKWNDSNEYCLSWRVFKDGTEMMKDVGYCSF